MSEETKIQRPGGVIQLENPTAQHHGSFIVGNAQYCERVVEENSHKGQTLVICGAGPSLRDNAEKYCKGDYVVWGGNSAGPWLIENGYRCDAFYSVDQTPELVGEWVSAPDVDYILSTTCHPHLTEYLLAKGRRIYWHHNFVGIKKPPVQYRACMDCNSMASRKGDFCDGYSLCLNCMNWTTVQESPTCKSCGRDTVASNPGCGSAALHDVLISYEDWLYLMFYPGTIRAGSGLNTVSRAIDVAMFMGFEKIYVLGADCMMTMKSPCPKGAVFGTAEYKEWLDKETVMHANGGSATANNQSPLTLMATIDPGTKDERIRRGKGLPVLTKVDLLVTAVFLVEMERQLKGRVKLVGEGLPYILRNKSKAFLQRLVSFVGTDGSERPVEYLQGAA